MIELGGGYVIGHDGIQYMLGAKRAKGKKTGHIDWTYFFHDLEEALEHYVLIAEAKQISAAEAVSATEAALVVRRTHEETREFLRALTNYLAEEGEE